MDIRIFRAAHFVVRLYKILYVGRGVYLMTNPEDPTRAYQVDIGPGEMHCSCEDYKKRRGRLCKHLIAANALEKYWGSKIKSFALPFTVPLSDRPAPLYGDDSHPDAYYEEARRRPRNNITFPEGPAEMTRRNHAAAAMPKRSVEILGSLCDYLKADLKIESDAKHRKEGTDPNRLPAGGQAIPMEQRLFATVFRMLKNVTYDDAKDALQPYVGRFIDRNPSKNCYTTFVHELEQSALLSKCLTRQALQVQNIEKAIIFDSTAFSTSKLEIWNGSEYGAKSRDARNAWYKAHGVTGALTNIVAGVVTSLNTGESSHDTNFYGELLAYACRAWDPKWALADKGYLSALNVALTEARNMIPIIPIMSNWNVDKDHPEGVTALISMYFDHPELFDELYRYRSKIESVFSAIKRTSGWHTRAHFRPIQDVEIAKYAIDPRIAKIGIGRVNEIKARFVAHNCRQLVTLEHLHETRVSFVANGRFAPLPREFYRAPSLLHAS